MSKFYEAVAEWLRSEGYLCDEVTDVEQDSWTSAGCETCWYEYTEVTVHYNYTDEDGHHLTTYTYSGDMAEFVRDLP
jgi:hypothetical protein